MATIPVIRVQDLKVCFSDRPRYFPTNQNPLSFTWENPEAPAAIAITITAVSEGEIAEEVKTGAVIPAAVIMATVADPCSNLTNNATVKPKNRGLKSVP